MDKIKELIKDAKKDYIFYLKTGDHCDAPTQYIPELIIGCERLEKENLVLYSACTSLGAECKDIQKLEEKITKLKCVVAKTEQLLRNIAIIIKNPHQYNLEHDNVLLVTLQELHPKLQQVLQEYLFKEE